MPQKIKNCQRCKKQFCTSTNPKKEKDFCGKCLHKQNLEAWQKKQEEIERGYREGHNRHEREPYFRETLGTAWGIRKTWLPYEEYLKLREKYKNSPIKTEIVKKQTKRRPKVDKKE